MNRLAVCRECQSIVAANATVGHTEWHLQISKAILMATGLVDGEQLEQIIKRQRLMYEGKYSVAW